MAAQGGGRDENRPEHRRRSSRPHRRDLALQGLNLLGGSFMTGQTQWLVIEFSPPWLASGCSAGPTGGAERCRELPPGGLMQILAPGAIFPLASTSSFWRIGPVGAMRRKRSREAIGEEMYGGKRVRRPGDAWHPLARDQSHPSLERRGRLDVALRFRAARRTLPSFLRAVPDHLLVLHLDGPVGVSRYLGKGQARRAIPPGGLFILPGGTDFGVRLEGSLKAFTSRSAIPSCAKSPANCSARMPIE